MRLLHPDESGFIGAPHSDKGRECITVTVCSLLTSIGEVDLSLPLGYIIGNTPFHLLFPYSFLQPLS